MLIWVHSVGCCQYLWCSTGNLFTTSLFSFALAESNTHLLYLNANLTQKFTAGEGDSLPNISDSNWDSEERYFPASRIQESSLIKNHWYYNRFLFIRVNIIPVKSVSCFQATQILVKFKWEPPLQPCRLKEPLKHTFYPILKELLCPETADYQFTEHTDVSIGTISPFLH